MSGFEDQSAEQLLQVVLGGSGSPEEILTAISDDLNVLWLAQQSESVEPDVFGLFLVRLQARVDVAAELARRTREATNSQQLNVVSIKRGPGPFAGGPE